MRVLVACEMSGRVREAFAKRGHDAWSCDLLPTEISSEKHIEGDVLEILGDGWDLMIAHPPCTHLSNSGARWFTEGRKPMYLREQALEFVRHLMDSPIDKWAIENPIGAISSHIRKPNQTINPWQYGHPEQKRTCIWLKGLPPLVPTNDVYDHMMTLPIQQRQRIHWLGGGKGQERSLTYQGWADAMAEQWG